MSTNLLYENKSTLGTLMEVMHYFYFANLQLRSDSYQTNFSLPTLKVIRKEHRVSWL